MKNFKFTKAMIKGKYKVMKANLIATEKRTEKNREKEEVMRAIFEYLWGEYWSRKKPNQTRYIFGEKQI